MFEMAQILGVIAVAIGLYGYVPYFRDIFKGKTKPHAFSWLIWGILTGIGFLAQVFDNGGPGAWVTGVTAFVCIMIFLLALSRGEKNITKSDWWCLLGAFLAIGLWLITDDPLIAVVLITVIDALGFIPTFRKSYHRPDQETAVTYVLSGVKFIVAIAALSNFSLVTVLYPLSLVLMNGLFVAMLYIRRKQLT